MKIALVSSVGGHLTDLIALRGAYERDDRFWIVNDRSPVLARDERAYVISHAERDWRVVWNVFEVAAIFAKEKPDLVVSTGAGPAIPAAVVARLAKVPVLYVECSCAVVDLTLTGTLMRPLANEFFVQWEALKHRAPWARYEGGVL